MSSVTEWANHGYSEVRRALEAGEDLLAMTLMLYIRRRINELLCSYGKRHRLCARPAVNAGGYCYHHARMFQAWGSIGGKQRGLGRVVQAHIKESA